MTNDQCFQSEVKNELVLNEKVRNLPGEYYSFEKYVSRTRMLTFWYQIKEVLSKQPQSVLEVGIGPSVVQGVLRQLGINVKTVDINANLKPDYLIPVQKLSSAIEQEKFDVVLCARVLHHIGFTEFEKCLEQLSYASNDTVILTLPVDNLKLYGALKITSREARWFTISVPLFIKRFILKFNKMDNSYYSKLWKINSDEATSIVNVEKVISKFFYIRKAYNLPEENSHRLYVLQNK